MRKFYLFILYFVVTFLCFESCKQCTKTQSEDSKMYNLGLGWNLGNSLDCYTDTIADETSWGNKPVTKSLIDSVKTCGFQSIRIPVTWKNHLSMPDCMIDPQWMNRVAEVVSWCEQAGLKVIINLHHDGADSKFWLNIKQASASEEADSVIKHQIETVWNQIATRFKDCGDFLVFEGFNEIHDGGWGWGANRSDFGKQYQILNSWNQLFVNTVRATGGCNSSRWLGIPGYVTNPELTMQYLELPKDTVNKLMVAVHFYDPFDYTLLNKFTQWGKDADPKKCAKHGDENSMDSLFFKLNEKYVKNNIPVYIGEFGCVHRDNSEDEKFRIYYLSTLCKTAKKYNLSALYWDNGYSGAGEEQSGLFDRSTGEFFNNSREVVKAMIESYN